MRDLKWLIRGVTTVVAVASAAGFAAAQQQTIVLSTGVAGQSGTSLIAPFQSDDDWRVVADPLVAHPLPRAAMVVNANGPGHMKWALTLPNSRWISGAGNKYNGLLPSAPALTEFAYRTCFMLPAIFWRPALALQVRGDDAITIVTVNFHTTLFQVQGGIPRASATSVGSFLGAPLPITDTDAAHFRPGQNCVDVNVMDLDSMISGLNVAGTMTYQGCTQAGQIIEFDISTGTSTAGGKIQAGTVDPKWSLAAVPTGTPGFAFSVNPAAGTGWVSNAPQPANWIQRINRATAKDDDGGLYTYRLAIPPGLNSGVFSSMVVLMRYAADNSATVSVNGVQRDACGGVTCFKGWRAVAPVFASSINSVTVDVNNGNNSYTGLILEGRIQATCK